MPTASLLKHAAPFVPESTEPGPHLYRRLALEANRVRRQVLDMAVFAGSGHVTSAFSQTDLLCALYMGGLMRHRPDDAVWPGRDRFIISKGQGGIGLYAVLGRCGYFPMSELDNFCGPGSHLSVHAEAGVPGIEVHSGSLGHGLPIATGIAQAGKLDGRDWLVFCLLGDGEMFEGANYEALTYAASADLGNLVCIVDRNRQGVLGFTDEIEGAKDGPRLESLDAKFRAFGFETRRFDGHDFAAIFAACADLRTRDRRRPLALIADTVKGKGCGVFENRRLWHYRVPKGEELKRAYDELDAERRALEAT